MARSYRSGGDPRNQNARIIRERRRGGCYYSDPGTLIAIQDLGVSPEDVVQFRAARRTHKLPPQVTDRLTDQAALWASDITNAPIPDHLLNEYRNRSQRDDWFT